MLQDGSKLLLKKGAKDAVTPDAGDLTKCLAAPRTISKIGELTKQERDALKSIGEGGPRSALPLELREALAAHYRRIGKLPANPAGFAQRAFQEARARHLLGHGTNPGPSVHEFSRLTEIPILRRGGEQ